MTYPSSKKSSLSLALVGLCCLSGCILPARRAPAPVNPEPGSGEQAVQEPARSGRGTAQVAVVGAKQGREVRALKPGGAAKPADPAQDFQPSDGQGALAVTDVVPSIVVPGTMVEIRGSGFGPSATDNKVVVGGVAWDVRAVYSGRLIAVVPGNAVSGQLEASTNAGKANFATRIGVMAADSAFGRPAPDLHGLIGLVYPLTANASTMPDFKSAGTPVATLAAPTIDMKASLPAAIPTPTGPLGTKLAIRWVGSLNITEGAEYQMCLESDDGSALFLEDISVVDNGGVHKMQKKCEVVYLEPGEYRVDLRYFQGASPSMGLRWTWKAGEGQETVVPSTALYRPE